ncbi:Sugar (and other) transporter [Rhizoctonia solani]|uniref:Sugar (And other) transporter n=1 Tax=Rhizoctonia solani TaxID=456999 RepID=A0A8H8NPH8_9AGAM|nr:Sugar (and other) transporter [Rhizoctonia solani]QRW16323.1 Sugar (and other) transporter [Rhizoctonia solani]
MGYSIDKRDVISVAFVGFASLGGFIMGSLVVSILSAGTFFGALSSALFADGLGRRLGIIVTSILFMAGVGLQVGAPGIAAFAVGRAITGYGLGAMVACIPTYQSECAPKSIRGALVMGSQLATTIGLMIAAVANQAALKVTGEKSWRIPIAIQIAFAGVLCIGMFFLPESPRYYIKKGRNEDALRAISRLRARSKTDPAVVEEYEEMAGDKQDQNQDLDWTGFPGHSAVDRYQLYLLLWDDLLREFWNQGSIPNSVLTNVVNVVATFPAFVLIDRWADAPPHLGRLFPLGPVAWVLNAEMFPLAVRAKGLAMTNATNWAVNFGISYSIPYLVNDGPQSLGLGARVYFLWGSLSALCCAYAYFFIPEPRDLHSNKWICFSSIAHLASLLPAASSFSENPTLPPSKMAFQA